MKNLSTKIYLVFLSLLLLSYLVPAQSIKEPTPAEKVLLHKAIFIIQSVLDRFGNNDWGLEQDWYNNNPLVPSDDDGTGAIGIDQNFERDYKVNENSNRFKNVILPINNIVKPMIDREAAAMQEAEKHPANNDNVKDPLADSLDALYHKMTELSELHVYAYINRADVEGRPTNDVNIPGAAMVTKIDKGFFSQGYFKSYFIAFGNWKSAKWNSEDNAYFYKFKKTPKSSIQNIVIVMTGARDRMKELMTKLDWNVLNKALSN